MSRGSRGGEDVVEAVASGDGRIVVIDVEATCWKPGVFSRRKETIEIGAVQVQFDRAPANWPEFETFVRPLRLPRLSSFCRELTGITQEDIDSAPAFPDALTRLLEWMPASPPIVLAAWSHYDVWQINLDLEAHGLPELDLPFLDVKKLAARTIGGRSLEETVRELAPDAAGMPRHRAIADARRTAAIVYRLLRAPRS
jgi:inhibitor of KinA sporulation pathway (predicted exonuclease)